MRCIPALKLTGIVCFFAFAITSCQKEISSEDGGGTNTPTNCQLSKITYYDSSGVQSDTGGIVYSNDKISRVNFKDYYITLIYANNRVTRINYFDHSNTEYDFYDSIRYTGNGKIESLIFYSQSVGGDEPSGGYMLSYNGDGTPSKVLEKVSAGGPALEDAYEYAFTYTTQNISKMTITELTTPLAISLNYTFDSETNYFTKFPSEFIFADNVYFGISSVQFGLWSPFLFNKNNVASMEGVPVTYEKDAKGNLTEVKMGGTRITSYTWNCQ